MIKRHRLLLAIGGFILIIGLALWPGRWSPPAYANVTLVSFTATALPGQPKIVVAWETATEFDTSGFFVDRSDSSTGPFTRISSFIIAEGSTVVGAQYAITDTITVWNQMYYYRLEVVNTDQTIDNHGPISVVVGAAPTNTSTSTRTPTVTPSRTATPTAQPSVEAVDPTLPSNNGIVVTLRVVTGETITPRPTNSSSLTAAVAPAATPTLFLGGDNVQPSAPVAGSIASVPNVAMVATVAPPPTAMVAQVPASTLVPTDAAPALVAPVVIATAAASPAAPTNSAGSEAVILIAAAILFLGIALVIWRQARQ